MTELWYNNIKILLTKLDEFFPNKKQSKIGMVLLVLITPLIDFKCFNNKDDATTKFISFFISNLMI